MQEKCCPTWVTAIEFCEDGLLNTRDSPVMMTPWIYQWIYSLLTMINHDLPVDLLIINYD